MKEPLHATPFMAYSVSHSIWVINLWQTRAPLIGRARIKAVAHSNAGRNALAILGPNLRKRQ